MVFVAFLLTLGGLGILVWLACVIRADARCAREGVDALLHLVRKGHGYPDPSAGAVVAEATSARAPVTATEPVSASIWLARSMSATAARPIVIVVSPRPAPAGVADVDPDAAPDGPSVLVTPPPSRIVRHLPPILRGNRALPVDPRDLYPLARKALRRYQHAIPEHEWDDLCQEIVLSAVSRGHRYDPSRGTVEQWISGVARNCVRYYLRGVSEAWPDLDLETVAAPEDELDRDRESLRQTLDAVPEPGRTIVERHVFEGRTFREIAEEMGLPVANVHRHYKATTTLLRARLREE